MKKKMTFKLKFNLTQLAVALFSLLFMILSATGMMIDYIAVSMLGVVWLLASIYIVVVMLKLERWETKASSNNPFINEWLTEVKKSIKKINNWMIYIAVVCLFLIAMVFLIFIIAFTTSDMLFSLVALLVIAAYPGVRYALPARKVASKMIKYTLQKFYKTPKAQYLASTLLQNATLSKEAKLEMVRNIETEYERELKEAK